MKLYTRAASFRAAKVLVAAELAGKSVEVVEASEKDVKGKTAASQLPLLETSDGCLFESNAIMRYVASGSDLLGKTPFEQAQVNSWVDFCSNEVEVPATMWTYPIVGYMENYADVTARATKDLKAALTVLENHLKTETFFVGRSITLADIALAAALVLPMKLVLDDKTRKSFVCVTRWFTTCVNQPAFLKVFGPVSLVKKAVKAPEAKAKAKAEPKKEEKPVEAAPAKPAKNPLELLPKSKLILDAWKRQYSNAPGGDCYKAMPWIWENFDAEGWTIFKSEYQYNDELKIGFQVSNLCGGFVQRMDAVRKYAFGTMQIIGKDGGPMEIVGCWLMRGNSAQPIIDANPDAEYHKWTPYELTDANKKEIADIWCAEEELFGKPILDCKVFK